jgi:hypothetical protein
MSQLRVSSFQIVTFLTLELAWTYCIVKRCKNIFFQFMNTCMTIVEQYPHACIDGALSSCKLISLYNTNQQVNNSMTSSLAVGRNKTIFNYVVTRKNLL